MTRFKSKYFKDRITDEMLSEMYEVNINLVKRLNFGFHPVYDAMIDGYSKLVLMSEDEKNSITKDNYYDRGYIGMTTVYGHTGLVGTIKRDNPILYMALLDFLPKGLHSAESEEYASHGSLVL